MFQNQKKKHNRFRSGQIQEATFTQQIFRGVFRLLIISAAIALVYYVTHLPALHITTVVVHGGETISHEDIRSSVLSELEGSYFLIVPKRFTYLYPEDRIMQVLGNNQRLHSISVVRDTKNSLAVSFEEYLPHALFCASNESDCFLMSREGFAFEKAPPLLGTTLLRHVDERKSEVTRGSVIESNRLAEIDSFIEKASENLGFRIGTVRYTKVDDIEFEINGGGKIFVSAQNDLGVSFTNLVSVLHAKEFTHITAGNFKYIDVRFPPKVFVNESFEETGTSTETTTSL
jgi:cell division septal protein FtsQ